MVATKSRKSGRPAYSVKEDSYILADLKQAGAAIEELQSTEASRTDDRTALYDHMIALFTGSHDLGMDPNMRYVKGDAKSAKPADIIFRVMGMLMAQQRCQYVSPSTLGKAHERANADRIEAHLNAIYPDLFRRYGVRWDYANRFWQLLVGASYIQQSFAPLYWDKNELGRRDDEKHAADDDQDTKTSKDRSYNERVANYKQFAGPPIMVECIDPRMIWPIRRPAEGVVAWVKKYRVTRYELSDAFSKRGKNIRQLDSGQWELVRGRSGEELPVNALTSSMESVDYYEYIDREYCYYVVGSTVVDKYRHKGGIKIFPAYGLPTGFVEPHLQNVGILWPVRNEIPQLDFARTLWANKAYLEVFPAMASIVDAEQDLLMDEENAPKVWDLKPGTIVQIRGKLQPIAENTASGTDFRAYVEMLASDIDLATISGLARGIAGAQQPGYAINQLSQGMRTLWKPIIESAELQLSMMYEHYLWMVANIFPGDASVYAESDMDEDTGRRQGDYVTLTGDDIDDYYRVIANLSPDLPIDKQGNMQIHWNLYKEGGLTWEQYVREGLGKVNPVAMKRQVQKEAMERELFGKVVEAAMALGEVKLENEILKARGFPELNPTFSRDNQKLKALRQPQQPGAPGMPGAGSMDPLAAALAGAGAPQAPGMPGPAGDPAAEAGLGARGIPPTVGANPANPTPGMRA